MLIKTLIFFPFLYLLTLVQSSFLPHFIFWGVTPNLIFILIIFLIFISSHLEWQVAGVLIGGFFLDIFSTTFLGFNVLLLLAITVFIKLILKKHVQIPLG